MLGSAAPLCTLHLRPQSVLNTNLQRRPSSVPRTYRSDHFVSKGFLSLDFLEDVPSG